jgi:Flp pilus assembly pilin Flp
VSKQLANDSRVRAGDGQALVEYALLIAFVAIACIGVLAVLGTTVSSAIQAMADAF